MTQQQPVTGRREQRLFPPVMLVSRILPGKSEAWRRFMQEVATTRRDAYEASRRDLGIYLERTWLYEAQGSVLGIIVIESDRPASLWEELATSTAPFDRWFRDQLLALQGVDFAEPLPTTAELLFEWHDPSVSAGTELGHDDPRCPE